MPTIEHLYELKRLPSLDNLVYPIIFRYRDVEITIVEVSKIESKWLKEYFVVVQLSRRYGRNVYTSKPFTITCSDVDDLVKKLRIECQKFRIFTTFLPQLSSKL